MNKRFWGVAVAVAYIASFTGGIATPDMFKSVPTLIAEAADGEYEPVSWVIEDSTITAGGQHEINIIISNSDGNPVSVAGASFNLMLNGMFNISRLVDVDRMEINEKYASDVSVDVENGVFEFRTIDGKGFKGEDGIVLAKVYYTIPENCPVGQYKVSLGNLYVYDEVGNDVSADISSTMGILNVVEKTDTPDISMLTYREYNDHVEIRGCDKSAVSVVIPAEIEGKPVTSIGNYAFEGCESLKEVTILDGVTSIGEGAFDSCTLLESITIPESVTEIGVNAFWGCSKLSEIVIPNGVTKIGRSAFYKCTSLESITLPDSVTSIGECAFQYCSSLTEVTIPDSLTSIGDGAFRECTSTETIDPNATIYGYRNSTAQAYAEKYERKFVAIDEEEIDISMLKYKVYDDYVEITGCDKSAVSVIIPAEIEGKPVTSIGNYAFLYNSSLKEIKILEGVMSIGEYAFKGCSSLESVTIPDSVTSIGDNAFYDCQSLKSITIPDSVTSIDYSTFSFCSSLESINVSEGNDYYSSEDGALLNKEKNKLICCPGGKESFVIPESVTSIGKYAFHSCLLLTEITVPNSVTSIGNDAFRGCSSLESVTIPDSVTSIGDSAFSFCSSLKEITIPESITNMSYSIFYCCSSLESITIPESVTSIEIYAFFDCSSLKSINIPANVTNIDYYAFRGCPSLESITIMNPECEIYDESMTIDPNATIYGYRNSTAQAYAEKYERNFVAIDEEEIDISMLEYVLADGDEDGNNDYVRITNCDINATNVVIPAEIEGLPVTVIESNAFADHMALESIELPEGLQYIDIAAFVNCGNLKSLTIPESVGCIDSWAFCGCYSLTSVEIPKNVEYFNGSSFAWCMGLSELTISPENENFVVEDGVVFSKDMSRLVLCPAGLKKESYEVPDSVEFIDISAFAGDKTLEKMTIPRSVTQISDDEVFQGCENLVIYCYDDAFAREFAEWNGIKVIAYNVIDDEYMAITYSNNDITSVVIPEEIDGWKVEAINGWAFCDRSTLTDIVIPESVTRIGDSAFLNCTSLEEINLPANLEIIENGAFSNCTSLRKITIPESVKSIGEWAFAECKSLEYIDIPANVDFINWTMFNECNSLRDINVSPENEYYSSEDGILFNKDKTVLYVYPRAKENKAYTIPDCVGWVSDFAFAGCEALESIEILSFCDIGGNAFENCKSLKAVDLPEHVGFISEGTFAGCDSLEEVTIRNFYIEIYGEKIFADNVVIHGYKGSTAYEYAEKYGNTFVAIERDLGIGVQTPYIKGAVVKNNKNRVSFAIERDVPEEITIIENGILYNTDGNFEADFTLESNTVSKAKNSSNTNQGTWTVNIADSKDNGICVVAYMIIEDAYGNQNTVYSEIAYGNYNEVVSWQFDGINNIVTLRPEVKGATFKNDKNRVSFAIERNVPDEYTIVENGIIYNTDGNGNDDFILENDEISKAKNSSNSNTGTWTVNIADSKNKGVHVRAYMIIKDADGNQTTVYSDDVAYGNYYWLVEEKFSDANINVNVNGATFKNDKKRVSFAIERNVPEGLTIVENGIIYNTNGNGNDDFILENDEISKAKNSSNSNTGTWTVNIADSKNKGIHVRAYMIVKDADGNQTTVYSDDVAYGNYNWIIDEEFNGVNVNVNVNGATFKNDKKRVSFAIERNVPEGLTIVENGIIYNTNGNGNDDFILENDEISKAKNSSNSNTGTWTVNIADSKNKGVHVRAYMIVRDDNGNQITVYSDEVAYGNYNWIIEEEFACISVNPVINGTVVTGGKNRVSFAIERDIPEEFTIVENGILYNNNGNFNADYVLGSDTVSNAVNSSNSNQGTWTVNIADKGKGVCLVGYMTVKDNSGNQVTVYSDFIYGNFMELTE